MSVDPQVQRLNELNRGPAAARPGITPERTELKAVGNYVVTSTRRVLGKLKGEVVDVAELTVSQLKALVEGGHLKPVTTPAAVELHKPATPEVVHVKDSDSISAADTSKTA